MNTRTFTEFCIDQYDGELDENIAYVWDYEADVPLKYLRENEATLGPIQVGHRNPASWLKWDLLFFKDSSVFSPAANFFRKHKVYTKHIKGSMLYRQFWKEERNRCKFGYSVGGIYIPGFYYFYLNYSRIVVDDPIEGEKEDFPMFTTMDYLFFLELNLCMNHPDPKERKHMVIAKARRKGCSYKMGVVCAWRYTFFKNTQSMIAAELADKAKETFSFLNRTLDWLTPAPEKGNTEFWQSTPKQSSMEIIAAVPQIVNGRKVLVGNNNKVKAVSLHEKPGAAAGKGGSFIIIDEAGECKQLKRAVDITEPVLRAGARLKGIMVVFGTGNAMDDGAEPFQKLFYSPKENGFKEYDNHHDLDQEGKAGYFIDETMFRLYCEHTIDGKTYHSIDENGNCFRWVAEIDLNRERKEMEHADDFIGKLSQYCKTPEEAFATRGSNFFPAQELSKVLLKVTQIEQKYPPYVKGTLREENKRVIFEPNNKLHNLSEWPLDKAVLDDPNKIRGCIVQYYAPQTIDGEVPENAYIIGYDPWAVDISLTDMTNDNSLGAVYVMRTQKYVAELGIPQNIVATYIGRTSMSDDFHYNVYKLAKYYNAKIMFENDVGGKVEDYFRRRHALDMLLSPPKYVIKKHTPESKMKNKKFGFSSNNKKFKAEALLYVKDWLLDEQPDGTKNYETIRDRGLLKELISYRFDKGNFDRVIALVGCILHIEDIHEEFLAGDTKKKSYKNRYEFLTNNRLIRQNESRKRYSHEETSYS